VFAPITSSSHSWFLPWFDLDRTQQRCGRDHHQDASETECDLHGKSIRDVDQRYVAGERQQNAEAIDCQRVLATADCPAHYRRRQPSPIARHEPYCQNRKGKKCSTRKGSRSDLSTG